MYVLGHNLFLKKTDKYYIFNLKYEEEGEVAYVQVIAPEVKTAGMIETYIVSLPESTSPLLDQFVLEGEGDDVKVYSWPEVSDNTFMSHVSNILSKNKPFLTFYSDDYDADCLMGDCQNGWGAKRYPVEGYNDGYYIGFFKNGKRHYFGSYYWPLGGSYTGTFYNDQYDYLKQGFEITSDGTCKLHHNGNIDWGETGCVSGDCTDGWGVYIYSDGGLHAGYWDKDGKEHLLGIHLWASGAYWMGLYEHGDRKSSRKGIYCWPDGDYKIYHSLGVTSGNGCLMGDCENGWGAYRWENGDIHIGFWKNGDQHLQAFKYWADGDFFYGLYKDGERLKRGLYVFGDGTIEPRFEKVYY